MFLDRMPVMSDEPTRISGFCEAALDRRNVDQEVALVAGMERKMSAVRLSWRVGCAGGGHQPQNGLTGTTWWASCRRSWETPRTRISSRGVSKLDVQKSLQQVIGLPG